jgi:hypothetical protein
MDGRKSKKQKRAGQGGAVPHLSCIEPHAAGVDVGATEIFVAVPQETEILARFAVLRRLPRICTG